MASKVNMVYTDIDKIGTTDATTNDTFIDVLGNKADAANRTVSQASVIGLLRQLDGDLTTLASSIGTVGTISGTADSGTANTLVDAALTQADDYFNGMILVITSGTNIGLARTIVDFAAGTDTITVEPAFPAALTTNTYTILPRDTFANILIGHNNADNAADTTLVVANADGSVLERLEYVQTDSASIISAIGTPVGADISADIASVQTDTTAILTDIGTTIPALIGTPAVDLAADILVIDGYHDVPVADVADNVVMSDVIGNKTDTVAGDSLIALAKQIIVDTGTDIPTLIGTPVTDVSTDIADISTLIGTPVADVSTDIAGIQSDVTTIDGIVDNIYVGTSRIAEVQTPDASATAWTIAPHRLFTVSGVAEIVKIVASVKETVVEGATGDNTLSVGTANDVDMMIGVTAGSDLAQYDIWSKITATHTSKYTVLANNESFVIEDVDIDLDVLGTDSITDGTIKFYVEWRPISTGATVTAAVWD